MELASRYIILVLLQTVNCLPLNKDVNRRPVIPTSEQIGFMEKYGYLVEDQSEIAAQYTEDTIIRALKNVQKFGAIKQTGIFDDATIKLMKKRRCGNKDIFIINNRQKRYTIMGRGWRKRTINYSVSSWNQELGEEAVKSEIKRALEMWGIHANLTFVQTDVSDANIKVSFHSGNHGDKYPFDGPGNILAHAFFPYVTNSGKVHFDNDEYWSLETYSQDDERETTGFYSVAVHELGHTLGIGHSDEPNAVMFPYYTESDNLDDDDIAAVQKLYITMMNDIPTSTTEITPENDITLSTVEYTSPPTKSYTKNNIETTHNTIDYDSVDICKGYDTIGVIRNEIFVFKDENVWRYKTRSLLNDGYPVNIHKQFPNLPNSLNKINAVYEMKNGTIVFFSGSKRWMYSDDNIYGPLTLKNYNFPMNTTLDAVMLWSLNSKTYLFKGDQFWRYDEEMNALDLDYPKNMTRWKGVPNDINAAIQWSKDLTYFFKGSYFWRFDYNTMATVKRYPYPTAQVWFGCPETNTMDEHLYV